jgi:multicomponent Na+:H+ antiporter subunit D
MFDPWILPLILLSSAVPAAVIFWLKDESRGLRMAINLGGAGLKLILVGIVVWGVYHERTYALRLSFLPGLDLLLRVDALSMLFAALSALLWFLTTIYAVGYLEASPHRSRFFGFFSLCVTATIGVALAGNLITFLVFYELLTLSTYPLVVHRGTEKSLRAGRTYLAYTVGGGGVLTVAIAWLQVVAGPVAFTTGGALAHVARDHPGALVWIFGLMIAGLGVKASLVPLHGWLPQAMVAPAPVSALLHAVAVVKAGAFGIVRVVYDVYGVRLASQLGLVQVLAVAAAITIVYGSIRALFQDDLKKRLAYSTISQVSYIALGVALFGPVASIGGAVHLVHQGLMKITLFFCAGSFSETLGVRRVGDMDGVGRRMPWTMAAFTVGALGMIGVPPLAGFVTKWYLATGAWEAGQPWVIAVLAASSLLNAAYFLPVLYAGWFKPQVGPWPEEHPSVAGEAHWMLLGPSLVTAALVLVSGILANAPFTPLEWVRLLVAREYE